MKDQEGCEAACGWFFSTGSGIFHTGVELPQSYQRLHPHQ